MKQEFKDLKEIFSVTLDVKAPLAKEDIVSLKKGSLRMLDTIINAMEILRDNGSDKFDVPLYEAVIKERAERQLKWYNYIREQQAKNEVAN